MADERSTPTAETGMTALFIRRPILAFVLNVLIVVAGLAALFGVDVRELPEVDRPVITIRSNYTGASAETIDREVTAILEGAVARVPGIKSISSSSSFGNSRVTIEFNDGVDLDAAASDMRDAVSRSLRQLPDGIDPPRVIKADDNSDAVIRLAVTSDDMTIQDLTLLVDDQIVDTLAAVPGVADVQMFGDRDKIFRVDIDQGKLASLGLTVGDIANALSSMAFDAPAGALSSNNQNLIVRATAAVTTPAQFENLIIGGRTRLGDVATVTLGGDIGQTQLRANGKTGIGLGILRQAQSNTLEISAGVHAAVERIGPTLPAGVELFVTSDDARFIEGAIHEVEIALAISVSVVLLIIFLFLLDFRATLIPGLAMPVALIGSVAGIYLAGFSMNILTLLAFVLAAGLVVDDAIVVLENIVRRRNLGLGPRAAAVLGTQEVFFAVVATTATLVAVFVPLSFLPGQTGGLFREFGFVLAIAVILSAVVALSLCPMLASRMLKHTDHEHSRTSLLGRLGALMSGLYRRILRLALNAPLVAVLISVLFAGTAAGLFGTIRSELTPQEDRAMAFIRISAPQGVSLDYVGQKVREIERRIQPLRDNGEIRSTYGSVGQGGSSNNAFMVMSLAPWDERSRSQQEIIDDITQRISDVYGIRAFTFQPNSLGIRGAGNGLQFAVVGNNYAQLNATAQKIVADLEREPGFRQPRLSNDATQPQLSVVFDRERASDLGIDITGLAAAMQAMLDGREIGSVFIDDRAYDVKLISTNNPVNDPTDLENIFLRTSDGRFVPMSTIATLTERAVAPSLAREQQMRSVSITSALSSDLALGDAYQKALEVASRHMGEENRIIPLAEAATLSETSSGVLIIFGFAIVIILLVLAAQFESFVSAVIIMATVPLGLACAIYAMLLTGTSLNVYSQIGLVLLVGIMAKNGILIVEFANQLRDRGYGVREAIEEASNIRLRPVLMTMLCTVVGGLPLILASGAGAEARVSLGWVIVGGLGLSTMATLFITPVAYLLLGRFVTPKVEEEKRLHRELLAAERQAHPEPAE